MTEYTLDCADKTLRTAILTCFAADERVAGENLRIGVSNGIVHLAGMAASTEGG